jgi:transcriptional regulator GlxA family with amidase domain
MYASRQRLEIRLWDHLWEFRELLQAQSRKDSQAPMAERARQSIDERLAQPLRLGALADELGVSQAHLCRAFKSAFGQSPGTYRRTRRAEQARMLLAQTTMSLAQVAGHTGLGSMQNCNKALRRTFGLSSRRLRYGS